MKQNLTIKQEAFAQAFIRLGDKTAAYREVYSCNNLKPKSIHELASTLSTNIKVASRIKELQDIARKASEDEFSHTITDSLKLDFQLIKRYNKHLEILENQQSTDKQVDAAKRAMAFIKVQGFNAAMDRVSKKLGFYEKNNEQIKPVINFDINDSESRDKRIKELIAKAQNHNNI